MMHISMLPNLRKRHHMLRAVSGDTRYKRAIIIKVQNGLANRLRTINSFFSLAQETGALLKVCWESGTGWSDEQFLDLFMPVRGIEFITSLEFNVFQKSFFNLDQKLVKNESGGYDFFAPKEKLLSLIYTNCFTYEGDGCLEYMFDPDFAGENKLYDLLIPKPHLLNVINSFQLEEALGVHIRRGDSKYHPNQDMYQLSDNESFINHINEEIQLKPRIKIFLATDCLETQQYFQSLYPNRIFFNKNKKFNESKSYLSAKPYQSDAVIDLFALSKTYKIIGNNLSSFSRFASKLKNVPLVIAKNITKKVFEKRKNVLRIKYVKDWQYPAITEKLSYTNHIQKDSFDENLYIGFPWASFIDHVSQYEDKDFESVDYLLNKMISGLGLEYFEKSFDLEYIKKCESHTVCQHILWEKLLPLWNYFGIKNIHVSHLTTGANVLNDIKLHPWHLAAANIENHNLNKGLLFQQAKNKKYLCSFLGNHNKFYRSNIRVELQKIITRSSKCFYSLGDSWFFNKIVYDHQIRNKRYNLKEAQSGTVKYNRMLSDSVFSLCPEGTGPNTIRLWESMGIGSIPVLFENDWVRPEIPDVDWEDVCVTVKNDELDNIIEILESIPKDKIEYMQINCINAYNKIRVKTCF